MREILFRGLKKVHKRDNPEDEEKPRWVYGSLSLIDDQAFISTIEQWNCISWTSVNPETVGQYIGLNDSTTWEELTEKEREQWTRSGNMPSEWKGRKIFEGDIVDVQVGGKWIGVVKYNQSVAAFKCCAKNIHEKDVQDDLFDSECKIIGNEFENQEMLHG